VKIPLLTSFTTPAAEETVTSTGALAEVELALRRAHAKLDAEGRRMPRSVSVEQELFAEGWRKARVWAPPGLPRASNDSHDGWKRFEQDGVAFGIAVEVEWDYKRVYLDFLKLWRGQKGGQSRAGIIVLRAPDSFHYAVQHQHALYRELFNGLAIAFCALGDPELADPRYRETSSPLAASMP
jgi:hypothetical protein